jgi:hypothetical protein
VAGEVSAILRDSNDKEQSQDQERREGEEEIDIHGHSIIVLQCYTAIIEYLCFNSLRASH